MAPAARYRVGVIGCGRAGAVRAHAFHVHPACEVTAVADTDAENRAFGCERFGVPGYATWDEMFAAEQIDIAMPVLPVRPNADAVVAAAEAGVRAIFCEKPLTARLSDADRMVEACRARGVHLAAGIVVSSHADYRKAYALAAAGEIGQVVRIHLYEDNAQGGCHGLNLARKFAGRAPVEWVTGWVDGDPASDHEESYDDAATGFGAIGGTLRFANGIECLSTYADVGWRGLEVVGTGGIIRNWNNTALGLQLLRCDEPPVGAPRGPREPVLVDGIFEPYAAVEPGFDAHGWRDPGEVMRQIVQAIVDALDHGTPLEVTTGDDLRRALEIAIALRESHRRGHEAVRLPLADRDLVMYPEQSRWHYKKDVHGREWYRQQMASLTRP